MLSTKYMDYLLCSVEITDDDSTWGFILYGLNMMSHIAMIASLRCYHYYAATLILLAKKFASVMYTGLWFLKERLMHFSCYSGSS